MTIKVGCLSPRHERQLTKPPELYKTWGPPVCFSTVPFFLNNLPDQVQSQKRKRFKIEIEIFEALENTWCHKKGDKFQYPADIGKICPWLLSSMHDQIRLLEYDATLTWMYEGTPYEKIINQNGITTEFVRCPDPTSNLVAKIIRTEINQ